MAVKSIRSLSMTTCVAKPKFGADGKPGGERQKKVWYWVRLESMAGTGNTTSWMRHIHGLQFPYLFTKILKLI